jgi:hypothetical protein
VLEVKKENRLNCEVPAVWLPQNDCVTISQPKRLDLLDERTFVVEQNEIVAVARRVLKARLDPQHCEAGLG